MGWVVGWGGAAFVDGGDVFGVFESGGGVVVYAGGGAGSGESGVVSVYVE